MPDDSRPPQIPRCQETIERGGTHWQCLSGFHVDDTPHRFPPDAEFGRMLHQQTTEWLAATLRDYVVRMRNLQSRMDATQAVAVDLAQTWAGGGVPDADTQLWMQANTPTAFRAAGL